MNRKVAIISTVGLIYDGITSVILSYLQAMDLTDLDIYVIGTVAVQLNIKEQIKNLGCHVIELPNRKTETFKYVWSLINFIRKHKIQIVHAHGNSGTLAIEMAAACIGGCKKRIAHSHNTRCDHTKADKLLRPIFNLFCTDALACGEAAGRFLFSGKKFTVLKNGRNLALYSYDIRIRKCIRDQYGIGDEIVMGHVGGFVPQKNHEFALQIYKAVLSSEPHARFFMIGDGELREKTEKKATELGIREKIVFTGNIDNVGQFLSAMDGMILPSLFEGLPLVVMEWQANGLPCLIADTVTKECAVTPLVQFETLDWAPDLWAERILVMIRSNQRQKSADEAVRKLQEAGFDIAKNADLLRNIYFENRGMFR